MDDAKGNWADELQNVLWVYRTTPQPSTNETPFWLTYGSDTMLPIELIIPTHRVAENQEEVNDIELSVRFKRLQHRLMCFDDNNFTRYKNCA